MLRAAARPKIAYIIRKMPTGVLFFSSHGDYLGKPRFVAKECSFEEARDIYIEAYNYWRGRYENYLDVKTGQVASDCEAAWRRALIYCALRPHVSGGDIYLLQRVAVKMYETPAIFWSGLLMRAYSEKDRDLLRRTVKALKILYID